jgi:type II secretory pathway predicted ATPase ExeA
MPDAIFSFFGLRENPFRINPDPRFIYLTEQAEATLDELVYSITTRKGLILLAGEVGTGKTMLLRRLLDWLGEQKMPTALIFNSHINPDHLLDFILNDFGITCESSVKSDKLMSLNRWLLERYRGGQTPVLIVDEAQGLSPQALEEIRLLLNFETPRHKLLQVVLAGQPELEEKLKRHELRQLRQRITLRCKTAPLTLEQTHGYIRERLRIAGAASEPIFEPDAVTSVHAYSHGIPRVINVLCDHALINACAEGSKTVAPRTVERAARECHLDRAESVARILNAGSYARTGLADGDSILAAVAGASNSPVPAGPDRNYPPPARWWPALPPMERIADVPIAHVPLAHVPADRGNFPAQTTIPQPSARAVAASTASNDLPTQPPMPEPHSFDDRSEPALQSRLVSQKDLVTWQKLSFEDSLTTARRMWRSWQESFSAEAQLVWRQTKRKVRSAEAQYWKPFLRAVRHEMRHLQSSAVRFASNPRWQELSHRYAVKVRAAWNRGKTEIPVRLAGIFGSAPKQPSTSSRPPRVNHRRSMASLKRWLYEPIGRGQRRSANYRQSHTGGR